MNEKFRATLGSDIESVRRSTVIPVSLRREYLDDGYEELQGVVVFRGWWDSSEKFDFTDDDETGYECAFSKEHLDGGYLPRNATLQEMFRVGVALGFELGGCLKASGLHGRFRFIVSGQFAKEDVGDCCVVRFHKQRPGQRWLLDDLEKYRQPVMTMDFTIE